ncbi:dTDP-glucose 4,6-dehydratase [Prosthecomicrobium pneumaticum]|uniref:dTDP-glucose 4,6-dehydratase n=1 Tax=Prosthecomicrobium pneumaticum TaxID=81895 RepID=A0A7W9CVE2_9HYPH|nr:dTDP-glucose 4,6-dehydratase [Prosthecomicrobium pneumaticum]MBB5752404.1 dTDP-glucose 4,6-dehydratase [Prosthecomicrobium pneumaticum]
MKTVLVTGGAGFIGSSLCRHLIAATDCRVVNFDLLTYAANPASLAPIEGDPRYAFVRGDIRDAEAVAAVFERYRPDAVVHLAAESHVDRSIAGPLAFVETNVLGTGVLLDQATRHRDRLPAEARDGFRFVHVSTDEVFGSLGSDGAFHEETRYDPSSPYSASKAASDHLAAAWWRTYGLGTIVTNCSNNYGPCQFPEKLIPLMILNALEGRPLPVYGDGGQVRDWLHVEDHAAALARVLEAGEPGSRYAIGGNAERTNLAVVHAICDTLDRLRPDGAGRRGLVSFVADRPGHDRRYAIDATRIGRDLGWRPARSFEDGLAATIAWYLDNRAWWEPLRRSVYKGERLGLLAAAQ